MAKFIATQMKDLAHSGDGTEVTFTIVTKHAGEMVFTMPASGLADFKLPQGRVAAKTTSAGGATKTQGVLHKPKKWILGAETTKHKIVALIFDPQSNKEAGFALSPKSANELAAGLVKSAETVSSYKPAKPN
jgi:hypothetical protein